MITRLSIHNQSIQPLWRDVFDGMMGFYHEQRSFMEENVILDLFNQVDMHAWQYAWSKHLVQKIKTSPLRPWVAGQINCPLDDMNEDQLCQFGVEGILSDEYIDEKPSFVSCSMN